MSSLGLFFILILGMLLINLKMKDGENSSCHMGFDRTSRKYILKGVF